MKVFKQNIANVLTVTRFFLAFVLLFFTKVEDQSKFLIVYFIAWFTDAIDGSIARHFKVSSDFGSKMDDIADYTLDLIMIGIMIYWIQAEVFYYLDMLVIMIFIRVVNTQITKHKFGKVYIIHTYLNKFAAFTAFLLPFVYVWFDFIEFTYAVLGVTILASFEETLIHLTFPDYKSERRSIFIKDKPETVFEEPADELASNS